MANIKEHNDNQYIKERDKIEKYLLRIIQRYFEIEYDYTQKNNESIIVESITRLKRDLLDNSGFIFSLNKKTGNIALSIQDFNGEQIFDKNTAFNKDFGIQQDTICEGDDPRLSDARTPLTHYHNIGNVQDLEKQLEMQLSNISHSHWNKKTLDLIQYTGTMTTIDLVVIESLVKMVANYTNQLIYSKDKLRETYQLYISALTNYINILNADMVNIKEFAQASITWLPDALAYADNQSVAFVPDLMEELTKYIRKKDFEQTQKVFNNAEYITTEGEFSLNPIERKFIFNEKEFNPENVNGDKLYDIYISGLRLGKDDWRWNDSISAFVYNSNEQSSYPCFISLNSFEVYTHRVTLTALQVDGNDKDDDTISVILAYNPVTGDSLSLMCTVGGQSLGSAGMGKMGACIVYNFNSIGAFSLSPFVIKDTSNNPIMWEDTRMTILVKRNYQTFQIWVGEESNIRSQLEPIQVDTDTFDIVPSTDPNIELNLMDYPDFFQFTQPCKYGYGNQSQANSTYLDIFFTSPGPVYKERYGNTDVSYKSVTTYALNNSIDINNANIKTWLVYDKDGTRHKEQLPIIDIKENGDIVNVHQKIVDNQLIIDASILNNIDADIDEKNFYDDNTILYASTLIPNDYLTQQKILDEKHINIAVINKSKNDFLIKNNIFPDCGQYYIQGMMYIDNPNNYYDRNGNTVNYFNWDIGQPFYNQAGMTFNMVYNLKNKMQLINIEVKCGYIAELNINTFNDYYPNAKVYYQILESKEE